MPGTRCTVYTCNNSWVKTKNETDSSISYFGFPKDPIIRKIWIHRCKRLGKWNPNSARICSVHFSDEQFEDDIEARLMGISRRKKLKSNAIPDINLTKEPTSEKSKASAMSRKSRLERRSTRQDIMKILSKSNEEDGKPIIPAPVPTAVPTEGSLLANLLSNKPITQPTTSTIVNHNPSCTSYILLPAVVCDTCKNVNITSVLQENENLKSKLKSLEESAAHAKKKFNPRSVVPNNILEANNETNVLVLGNQTNQDELFETFMQIEEDDDSTSLSGCEIYSPESESIVINKRKRNRGEENLIEQTYKIVTEQPDDEFETIGKCMAFKLRRMVEHQRNAAEHLCHDILHYGLQNKLDDYTYIEFP